MVVHDHHEYLCREEQRLKEDKERTKYWKKWGPYTAERQWATGMCERPSPKRHLLTLSYSSGRLFVSSLTLSSLVMLCLTSRKDPMAMLGVVCET